MTGTRIGTRTCPDVEYRLANFGGLGVVIRCRELSLKMEEPAEYEICDGGDTAVFDYYERNTYDDQDEFYLGDNWWPGSSARGIGWTGRFCRGIKC